MKNLLLIGLCLATPAAFAQVQMDKRIQLTGSGTDAQIEGVQVVDEDHDAANKIYVDTAIANRATTVSNLVYTLSTDKSSAATNPGYNTNHDPITVTATLGSGFAAVSLIVTGLPSGVTYSASPGGGFPTFSSTLTFDVAGSVAPGSYPLVVEGHGGVSVQSVNISLNVYDVRKVFLTAGQLESTATTSQRNDLCNTEASNAGLSGSFKAWISDGSANNVPGTSSLSYRLVNNTLLAWDWNDLTDNTIANPINVLADGSNAGSTTVWTGLNDNGTVGGSTCSNWTDGTNSQQGVFGNSGSTNNWSNDGTTNCGTPSTELGETLVASRCTGCGTTPVAGTCGSGCGIYNMNADCTFPPSITWGPFTYYNCMYDAAPISHRLYCFQQ